MGKYYQVYDHDQVGEKYVFPDILSEIRYLNDITPLLTTQCSCNISPDMLSWRRSLMTVSSLAALNVSWGFMASIMAPFLPLEAQAKGGTPSQFGPIFGIIHLALFLISPVMGKVVSRLGLGRVFKTGLLLISFSSVCFGLLTFITDSTLFLVLAYTLRIVEGVGGSALWTSMLALLLAR